jgi:hypothetical protein
VYFLISFELLIKEYCKLKPPSTEIPGPTRKVPASKNTGSETNEISIKNVKNTQNMGKDSHLTIQKNSNDDENYGSIEDDDEFDSMGKKEI